MVTYSKKWRNGSAFTSGGSVAKVVATIHLAFGAFSNPVSMIPTFYISDPRVGRIKRARGSKNLSTLAIPTNNHPSPSSFVHPLSPRPDITRNYGRIQHSRRWEYHLHRFLRVRQCRPNLDIDPTKPIGAESLLDREIGREPLNPLVSDTVLQGHVTLLTVYLGFPALSTKLKLASLNLLPYSRTVP